MHPIKLKLTELAATGASTCRCPAAAIRRGRHAALYELGRTDLSLARLAEAHTDALSILAGIGPPGTAWSALWRVGLRRNRQPPRVASRVPMEVLQLNGVKRYCSGAPFLDAALVTAHEGEELRLVELSLTRRGVTIDAGDWVSPAFRETATATVNFAQVAVRDTDIVGGSRWYLERPGFLARRLRPRCLLGRRVPQAWSTPRND